MKFEIKNRFTGNIIFTCDLSAGLETGSFSLQLGFAIKKAFKEGANLQNADLAGAGLEGAYLAGANLQNADLAGAYLAGTYLAGANLQNADLAGAYLAGAGLEGAYLAGAGLEGAYLVGANLEGAYLADANLVGAYLVGANLEGAYLVGANLEGAYLADANLQNANLEPIKNDFFVVLIKAIPEISLLEKSILEGKIDGSTYGGECACLCGTLEKSGRFGDECDMRDSSRPIERFFMGIKPGDTPANNEFSRIAFDWLQEFKSYVNNKGD